MPPFDIVAATLPGSLDTSVAIAASWAGAVGVLDIVHAPDRGLALEALRLTATRAAERDGPWGCRVDPSDAVLLDAVLSASGDRMDSLVLVPASRPALRRAIAAVRAVDAGAAGTRIWLECVSVHEARLGLEIDVDGLIAKGSESGGRVGEETTFILLQRLVALTDKPVLAHGGIGTHTVAACAAMGAAGVVVDSQLALTRESGSSSQARRLIARMDGTDTIVLTVGRQRYRVLRPAIPAASRPASAAPRPDPGGTRVRKQEAEVRVGWDDPATELWMLGQDASFARPLADRYLTVPGVIDALRSSVVRHIEVADGHRPLAEGGPLARSHGTRFPIVQGPMTRVSDRAAFAARVAEGGALPLLALALMPAADVATLLAETRALLAARPWGVGILGFVPQELREAQMEVLVADPPSFALIAGGRPDQALRLERAGITTYLHVPSPGLLDMFIADGARHFVFEGRECGGHVGPRSSFVLWDSMVDALLASVPAAELDRCHVLFAGGIHDGVSAAAVAATAAPLIERGVKVGVLAGTAYLFTLEAVEAGAVVQGFQDEAIACEGTVLLETGPGHATRCADTAYVRAFTRERERLIEAGIPPDEMRASLEALNLGRLRIASKGIGRDPSTSRSSGSPRYLALDEGTQHAEGMYMIGQVAVLRSSVCSIESLHTDIAVGATRQMGLAAARTRRPSATPARPSQVAIVGMSCLLPGATSLDRLWDNIVNKADAIREVPPDRWDPDRYFDPDPAARDRIYSRHGGFLDEIPFDPLRYGMPPSSLSSIEPLHLLTLELVRKALEDAGLVDRAFARERTAVVLGAGGGVADLGVGYAVRSALPALLGDVPASVLERLPEWTEDSFPGILMNVAAGRVANRFDLGGVNFIVDAACASSLAAIYLAVRELESGSSDLVIAGGVDTMQNPFAYLCFSKTHALSPTGRCRTFDAAADGIAISEGLAAVVLKRLEDAERDGDRIYAVIQGVAGSSDGRDKGLTRPRPEGQVRALERAYAKAGIDPATVELIEAHGTGTVAGDQAEVESLTRFFGAAGTARQACALGSIKSLIGHTKSTAGVAGLIKTALSLHYGVLPPTANVETPNPSARFPTTPFYLNTEPRPWIEADATRPRRAGVSSFGFGGTNFHAVLESYRGTSLAATAQPTAPSWPSELFVWSGGSRDEVRAALEAFRHDRVASGAASLAALAQWACQGADHAAPVRVAIVARSMDDLAARLEAGAKALADGGSPALPEQEGISIGDGLRDEAEAVAFLFPGQGSQRVGMLRDLALQFGEVRERYRLADELLADRLPSRLSRYVFPTPAFSDQERQERTDALTATNVAQPALGAASLGAHRLLSSLGIRAAMVAGHSYGEYVALCAAGVISEDVLYPLSEARGRCILDAATEETGTMAAVSAGVDDVESAIAPLDGVWISNINAPTQTVISGTRGGIQRAIAMLADRGITARPLNVACGFHSPLVAIARDRFASVLAGCTFGVPAIPVYSNRTGAPYPDDAAGIADLLAEHLAMPVRFAAEIEAMYAAGARTFIEVGPGSVLTNLVGQILAARPHRAIPIEMPGRPGITQLQHALGRLFADGVSMSLGRLFATRELPDIDGVSSDGRSGADGLSATSWLVSGGRARPAAASPAEAAPVSPVEPGAAAAPAVSPPSPPAPSGAIPAAVDAPRNGSTPEDRMTIGHSVPAVAWSGPTNVVTTADERVHAAGGAAAADGYLALESDPMVRFQRSMAHFLETQRQVMLTYLGGMPDGHDPSIPGMSVGSGRSLAPAGLVRGEVAPSGHGPSVSSAGPPELAQPTAVVTVAESAPALTAVALSEPVSTARAVVQERGAAFATPDVAPVASGDAPAEPTLEQRLVSLVSDRTGYHPEMLDVDANLEADLGVDSIKLVEILGTFLRAVLAPGQATPEGLMGTLTAARTIRAISDLVRPVLGSGGHAPSDEEPPRAAPAPGGPAGPSPAAIAPAPGSQTEPSRGPAEPSPAATASAPGAAIRAPLPRFVLRQVDAPLGDRTLPLRSDGVVLVTDDGSGVRRSLIRAFAEAGVRVATLSSADRPAPAGEDVHVTDLDDAASVRRVVDEIRARSGPITGIVHLAPRAPARDVGARDGGSGWDAPARDRVERDVMGLFHLLAATTDDLATAAASGGAFVVVGTRHEPTEDATCFAGGPAGLAGRGMAGTLRTAALEWPGLTARVVELDDVTDARQVARLMTEIRSPDPHHAVGYIDARRVAEVPVEIDPAAPADAALPLGPDSVVVVTGGARGITAQVACELAARYRPRIVLMGRSPLPSPEESAETAGVTEEAELKAILAVRLQASGTRVTPALVKGAHARLLHERDTRERLAEMRRHGSAVEHVVVDVRDDAALAAAIEAVYQTQGRLDGMVLGAGVIEDHLIKGKDPESFARVLQTKVRSAWTVARSVRPDLGFLVLFSSVAGQFGNPGQADYAAANQILDGIAVMLGRQLHGRVVSMIWDPWAGGMASVDVQRRFAEQGIQLVHAAEGRAAFIDELLSGADSVNRVILGSGPWQASAPRMGPSTGPRAVPSATGPLLDGLALDVSQGGVTSITLQLDRDRHAYLEDHLLDGSPVVPAAVALELVAEAAVEVGRGQVLASIDDFRVLKGVVLDTPARSLRIETRPIPGSDGISPGIGIGIVDAETGVPRFQATATIGPVGAIPDPPTLDGLRPYPLPINEAYETLLFHGPRLHGLTSIDGLGDDAIVATLVGSSPGMLLGREANTPWVVDPRMVDCAFQLAILWMRHAHDSTPLPASIRRAVWRGSSGPGPFRLKMLTRASVDGSLLETDCWFLDPQGAPVGYLQGVGYASSRALNRLARGTAGATVGREVAVAR